MNELLGRCRNLLSTHVTKFHLLKCLHVHNEQCEDKIFSIFCDGDNKSMCYAGENETCLAPRFSGIEYVYEHVEYEGQVAGIISYSINNKGYIYLLVNRFVIVSRDEHKSRVLPERLVQYDSYHGLYTTDVIPIKSLLRPLFVVPALDKNMRMGDIGKKDARYYIIDNDTVTCKHVLKYEMYLQKNTTKFCNKFTSATFSYLNYNCYLTVEEMQSIKHMFQTQRDMTCMDDGVIEDFEFDFSDDENIIFEDDDDDEDA